MKDINGTTLQVGDKVVHVKGKNQDASLAVGHITKFYKGTFNRDECSIDNGQSHVQENRIMKL